MNGTSQDREVALLFLKGIGTCYVFQIPANGMSKGKWKKEREKRASTFHPICIYWDVRGLHGRIEVESFTLIERSCAFMTPLRKISISRAFLPGKDSIYIYMYWLEVEEEKNQVYIEEWALFEQQTSR